MKRRVFATAIAVFMSVSFCGAMTQELVQKELEHYTYSENLYLDDWEKTSILAAGDVQDFYLKEVTMSVGDTYFIKGHPDTVYGVDERIFEIIKEDGIYKARAIKPGDGGVIADIPIPWEKDMVETHPMYFHVKPRGDGPRKQFTDSLYFQPSADETFEEISEMKVGETFYWKSRPDLSYKAGEDLFRVVSLGGVLQVLAVRAGDGVVDIYVPAGKRQLKPNRYRLRVHVTPSDNGTTDMIASGELTEEVMPLGQAFGMEGDNLARYGWFQDVDETMLQKISREGLNGLLPLKEGWTVYTAMVPVSGGGKTGIVPQKVLLHILPKDSKVEPLGKKHQLDTNSENFIALKAKTEQRIIDFGKGNAESGAASEVSAYVQEILTLVNKERAKAGARPLRLSQELTKAAVVRSRELTRSYSHTRPDGRSFDTAFGDNGRTCGENIAAGQSTPAEVMKGWMESPGHRQNILNPEYKELGVGCCASPQGGYGHYWVQIFRG